jgi:hypothetical protein
MRPQSLASDDALDLIWLSRNMTDAIYRTLRDPENCGWDDLEDAHTVIIAMPVGDLRDELMLRIKKAKREA